MNGPEHYAEAERLLRFADDEGRGTVEETSLLAEAQVHATLAVAAAKAAAIWAGPALRDAWVEVTK